MHLCRIFTLDARPLMPYRQQCAFHAYTAPRQKKKLVKKLNEGVNKTLEKWIQLEDETEIPGDFEVCGPIEPYYSGGVI